MHPDQNAPWEHSDLGPHCLQYRLHKNISRHESRQQMLCLVGKGLIFRGYVQFVLAHGKLIQ